MRGAAIFVERDRECVGLIFRNVATLRYEDRVQVRHADAYRWARTFRAGRRSIRSWSCSILLTRNIERRRKVLNQMIARACRKDAGRIGGRARGRASFSTSGSSPEFDTWDIRRYGSTQIAIKVIAGAPVDDEPWPG